MKLRKHQIHGRQEAIDTLMVIACRLASTMDDADTERLARLAMCCLEELGVSVDELADAMETVVDDIGRE